jgi:hypothetical protein
MIDPDQAPYVPPAGAYAAGPTGYPQEAGSGFLPPMAPVAAPKSSGLGVVALIAALVALIVPAIFAAINGMTIGSVIGQTGLDALSVSSNLAVLSPVRDEVLWAELAFWFGTILGVWAIIQGIVATVQRRGRGAGITAIIIAVIAPGAYFTALFVGLTMGVVSNAAPF